VRRAEEAWNSKTSPMDLANDVMGRKASARKGKCVDECREGLQES